MTDLTEKELLLKINENLEQIIDKLDEIDSNSRLDEINDKLERIIRHITDPNYVDIALL